MFGWTLVDTLLGGDAEWLTEAADFDLLQDDDPQDPAQEAPPEDMA